MTPGEALRAARLAQGYSQTDLACVLGISLQYLNDIEMGRRRYVERLTDRLPDEIRREVTKAIIAGHLKNL